MHELPLLNVDSMDVMERIRKIFTRRAPAYQPLEGGSVDHNGERIEGLNQGDFSWLEYSVFLLLGIAMLWAWYDPYVFRSHEALQMV